MNPQTSTQSKISSFKQKFATLGFLLVPVCPIVADLEAQNISNQHAYVNGLPEEIRLLIKETGRYAINDLNRDGWDDLWVHLFRKSTDGKFDIEIIMSDPRGDFDGDGIINFVEMLDFSNPWQPNEPFIEKTEAEIKADRKAAYLSARERDQFKIGHFHQQLLEAGVLGQLNAPVELEELDVFLQSIHLGNSDSESKSSETPSMQAINAISDELPAVLFHERLSSGNFMIAWEGHPEMLYDIEWSDDMVHWNLGGSSIPVVGGIGNWGSISLASKRFFRVVERDPTYTTIPSDPSGGDGITTFGATITPVSSGGVPVQFLVTSNLPAGVHASAVDLLVNGEMHSQARPTGVNNVFSAPLRIGALQQGQHSVQAILHANGGTTTMDPQPGGVFATPVYSFDVGQHPHAVGFRVTESMIAPDDMSLPPTTVITADIPYDPQGSGGVTILDENSSVVRQWSWGLDDYPQSFREVWDGTTDAGTQVSPGRYYVHLNFGGGSDFEEVIPVAAGQRQYSALILTENMRGSQNFNANYLPSWHPHFSSTGSPNPQAAWGPWLPLGSTARIVDEIRGRIDGVFGLGNTGKWRIRFWQSESEFSDPIPNPIVAFQNGQNPFNAYDLGIFIGHGVASIGGVTNLPNGSVLTKTPQHYFPLIVNRNTSETYWVESANIPKFGETGKLKWMFLMTCNPFSNQGVHAIYDVCKANDTLPFGDGLRVLCGYTTQIWLESGIGEHLSNGLVHLEPGTEFRDGTVVNAWGYVWAASSNRARNNRARAVYWPECKDDTIPGVPHENIPPLQQHASQSALLETDFIP